MSAIGFSMGILLVCMVLQRFALPAGGSLKISIATPLGVILALWGLGSGSLSLDRRRAALMMGLCGMAFAAYNFQVNMPLAMAPRSSLASGVYWLAVTSFAVLRFREPVSETAFFLMVNRLLVGIAIAGILQFVVQLAGIQIFAFSGILPANILIEEQFHVAAPFSFGLMRANGFFLVEPSVFSQFMAAGIIIELLYFKRPRALAILFAGLLASASGTGWMVLGTFMVASALTHGRSGIALALGTACLVAALLLGLSVVAPDVVNGLVQRQHEFWMPGTSGNERFVTPFMLVRDVLDDSWRAVVTGIGPGASEAVEVPYKYGVNAPAKILLEYGAVGLVLYLLLIVTNTRTPRQSALVIPMMFLLLFSGGNQLFSPILFPILLIITVARLE